MSAVIKTVLPGSIAEELGIEAGDILLEIGGDVVSDILDYQFYCQDDEFALVIEKKDGVIWDITIEKDLDEDLGLVFEDLIFDRLQICHNKCRFCFVDQLPKNMRSTLYVKDDDYRFSFLFGNFITLTNLEDKDWEKIIRLHLSPLYVSVHCIQSDLRASLLKNLKAANIKAQLQSLNDNGIEVHTQIVLCPGVNDGEILDETIKELALISPGVKTVGIVPLGLTNHRQGLPELMPVVELFAADLVERVNNMQKHYRASKGFGFVYLADEFFIKAKLDLPDSHYYDDFEQLENGIGITRLLLDEFEERKHEFEKYANKEKIFIVTGESSFVVLSKIIIALQTMNVKIDLLPIKNYFFGERVTVAGLLTGSDIIKHLGQEFSGTRIIVPQVMLKDNSEEFLDDLSIADIEAKCNVNISVVDGTISGLLSLFAAQYG